MRWLFKRWWLWAGSLFLLVAIVAGYLLILVSMSPISQETCDKIQLGWTPEQVVELLGPHHIPRRPWDSLGMLWSDEDDNYIAVSFDQRGVIYKSFVPTKLTFSELMHSRVKSRLQAIWSRLGY
jgi:hypothetical protein